MSKKKQKASFGEHMFTFLLISAGAVVMLIFTIAFIREILAWLSLAFFLVTK